MAEIGRPDLGRPQGDTRWQSEGRIWAVHKINRWWKSDGRIWAIHKVDRWQKFDGGI